MCNRAVQKHNDLDSLKLQAKQFSCGRPSSSNSIFNYLVEKFIKIYIMPWDSKSSNLGVVKTEGKNMKVREFDYGPWPLCLDRLLIHRVKTISRRS